MGDKSLCHVFFDRIADPMLCSLLRNETCSVQNLVLPISSWVQSTFGNQVNPLSPNLVTYSVRGCIKSLSCAATSLNKLSLFLFF